MAEFLAIRPSALIYLIVSQGSIARKPGGRLVVNALSGTYLLE